MGGKINLYNLGDLGIDLVSSKLHKPPGSWEKLQNAEFSDDEGQGGVTKRGSLRRLNADALNSGAKILVLANMPLTTDALVSSGGLLFVALSAGGALVSDDDGATFDTPAGLTAVATAIVSLDGVAYVLSSSPPVAKWTATTQTTEIAAVTDFPGMNSGSSFVALAAGAGKLWALLHDTTDGVARVYSWVPGDTPAQYNADIPLGGGVGDYTNVNALDVDDAGVAYVGADKLVDAAPVRHGVLLSGPTWTEDDPFSGDTTTDGQSFNVFVLGGAIILTGYFGAAGEPFLYDGATATQPASTSSGVGGAGGDRDGVPAVAVLFADPSGNVLAYTSDDEGATWTQDEDLTTLLSVSTFGVPAATRNTVYAGTTYTFALVTTAAGDTVARRHHVTGVWDLAPGIGAGQTLYCVGG